jgi:ATP phosphoribosyltransferase
MSFTIALPKGRLGEEAEAVLVRSKLMDSGLDRDSRKLIFRKGDLEILLVRAWDVPAYVEMGTADIGICGKDDLIEHDADVLELLDLGFGGCTMTVSAKKDTKRDTLFSRSFIKAATKYPNIARKFFSSISAQAEIIKLYGSVELAAVTGMCDCIIDIVSTGATLRENGLEVVEELFRSTARVIVNRASYYRNLSGIDSLIGTLRTGLK